MSINSTGGLLQTANRLISPCVIISRFVDIHAIASKLERECLGGCGVAVAQWSEHWRLKPGALGSIPGGCPNVFSSSMLSDVDGMMSSVVL